MKARHLAGSMCRFAVQRVLARPFWNISALTPAAGRLAAAQSAVPPPPVQRREQLFVVQLQRRGGGGPRGLHGFLLGHVPSLRPCSEPSPGWDPSAALQASDLTGVADQNALSGQFGSSCTVVSVAYDDGNTAP